ncbi:MAG: dihydropteroate synthase, partial [Acidimicrobiia bacterium]
MPRFRLGDVVHDLTSRTLVMGILNRTPDSFYDHGETFELDALVRRAETLVEQGADLLDIG